MFKEHKILQRSKLNVSEFTERQQFKIKSITCKL